MNAERKTHEWQIRLDLEEFLLITQSLGWLGRGSNRLRGHQFEQRLGCSEELVEDLFARLSNAHQPGHGAFLSLDDGDVLIIDRALHEILNGPAAIVTPGGGEPDWELIGGGDLEPRFWELRDAIGGLAERIKRAET